MYNKSALNIISDKILVYKAKRGDKEAYGKLYLRYFDAIYRYIFFRVSQNHEEAEDITEIVFFKAWEKFATFDEQPAGFRAWIFQCPSLQRAGEQAPLAHLRYVPPLGLCRPVRGGRILTSFPLVTPFGLTLGTD